jgi:5-methylcytosine-specific restriction endonuclease McrA
MKVYRVFSILEGEVVEEHWPSRCAYKRGHLVGPLTNLIAAPDPADIRWVINVRLSNAGDSKVVEMPLESFLSRGDYLASLSEPRSFADLDLRSAASAAMDLAGLNWLWMYRDGVYVTERAPRPSEMADVRLRIKAHHFRQSQDLARIREEVANYEAVEVNLRRPTGRPAIPDHVKLAVWSRDGGACLRCGAKTELHFDHIIAFSRGGSSTPENLQLLCRSCNLAKSDRLV